MGLLLAERIARLGLQPFNTASTLRASRQIEVTVHHTQLMVHALTAPLPPLPGTTCVLVAMCGISEREDFYSGASREAADPQRVHDFYRSNLAAELCCEGSHIEVCVRCATSGEPAFAASLTSLLRAIEDKPALGGSGAAGSSGASRLAQLALALCRRRRSAWRRRSPPPPPSPPTDTDTDTDSAPTSEANCRLEHPPDAVSHGLDADGGGPRRTREEGSPA